VYQLASIFLLLKPKLRKILSFNIAYLVINANSTGIIEGLWQSLYNGSKLTIITRKERGMNNLVSNFNISEGIVYAKEDKCYIARTNIYCCIPFFKAGYGSSGYRSDLSRTC
jgi:hypothetical protein